jgi:hypothetical protein
MCRASANSVAYEIPSNGEAVIQSWQCFAHAVYPRNSVVFRGNRFRVSHLGSAALSATDNALLIPYSICTIFYSYQSRQLQSLVFEFGSELRSIGFCAFSESSLKSLFCALAPSFSARVCIVLHSNCLHNVGLSIRKHLVHATSLFLHQLILSVRCTVIPRSFIIFILMPIIRT